jgi:hypothetical protein
MNGYPVLVGTAIGSARSSTVYELGVPEWTPPFNSYVIEY